MALEFYSTQNLAKIPASKRLAMLQQKVADKASGWSILILDKVDHEYRTESYMTF